MHYSKNKWSRGWVRNWFYYKLPGFDVTANDESEMVYPLASQLVDPNLVTHPEFSRRGSKVNERVYCNAYFYSNSRDLVEELCAADVQPLSKGFAIP